MTPPASLAVLFLLLSAVTAVSGWIIYQEVSSRQKEKEVFDTLAELVEGTPEKSDNEMEDTFQPSEDTEPMRDLSELFAQNDDCIGWLCIPDTQVSYPIMYTPDDPQKYLRRSFYGEYSQSGVPFLDYRCIPDSTNLIIYGHNMKNGTMFSDLKKLLDDTFLEEHPTIELQTADGVQLFTIMDKTKITEILAEILNIDVAELNCLDDNTKLTEIGLDSIKFIQFIVALEEAFNIEVNDSDLLFENFDTPEKLYTTLEKYFRNTYLKKVLICDCDNVLWKGIAGEEELVIDDVVLCWQQHLIRLYENGVLICLCSKNQEEYIFEAFKSDKMLLKTSHIVTMQINRNDKVQNIKAIARELNLSIDSFVFVDDSDYELGFVQSFLPEIQTIKADLNNLSFINKVSECFEVKSASDLNRTELYKQQKEREKTKHNFSDIDEYNASLGTCILCQTADKKDYDRLSELSMRTNQFNLSNSRYSLKEIDALSSDAQYSLLSVSLSDKYGDMGIVGMAVIKETNDAAIIESFLISCRVFDRGVEDKLLNHIKNLFTTKTIIGVYTVTDKNRHYQNFYTEHGVKCCEKQNNN